MTPPPRALCAHILVGFIAKNSRCNLYYHCADFNAFTPKCTIQLFFYTIWLDYIAHDVYNAEKKSYTVIFQGKKFLTPEVWEKTFLPKLNQPYPRPHKSQTVNHIGSGEVADLTPRMSSINKMVGASLSCGGFRVGNHMISSHVI